jgi:hypothetical protein
MFPKVSKPYNYIYAGVALEALDSEVQPLPRAAARSSLHPSPKFFIYSLRSGELPTKVRRAFPVTFLISGENRHCCKVALIVLYAVVYSNPCSFDRVPNLSLFSRRGTSMDGSSFIVFFFGRRRRCGRPLTPPAEAHPTQSHQSASPLPVSLSLSGSRSRLGDVAAAASRRSRRWRRRRRPSKSRPATWLR